MTNLINFPKKKNFEFVIKIKIGKYVETFTFEMVET